MMINTAVHHLRLTTTAILLFHLSAWSLAARGDLVGIEYYDYGTVNPESSGGPLWTGVVNTVTNTLQIDTWRELPRHGAEFWVPRNLPLVWEARDSSGSLYDLPNSFGSAVGSSATIDDSFAFISPVTAQNMEWEDIDGNPKTMGTIYPPTRPGWGGYAGIEVLGEEFVFHTGAVENEPAYDTGAVEDEPAYDEKTMPRLPVAPDAMFASTDAVVTVTSREVTAIPEASSFLAVGLVFSICAIARAMATHR